ncbi:hypothetical protein DFH07DRAFT_805649 [Mycena maculata]|uniref:Uncharacterized protein n=1 Tax=Mycena maculata TaxID=230809 RepID=A0AAD7JSP1_9AGAR|nr:hypothetical protein DFH07DRAFT_805649 [Mycena maculata]
MPVVTLSRLVLFCAGLAIAFPVHLPTEQGHNQFDPTSFVQKDSRAIEIAGASPTGQGSQLFAFDQWKRITPSRIHEYDPRSTIFNRARWEYERDVEQTSDPLATTAIFAHTQWEDAEATARTRRIQGEENHKNAVEVPRDELQGERKEESAGSGRKSTGPVFFAKVQWDE